MRLLQFNPRLPVLLLSSLILGCITLTQAVQAAEQPSVISVSAEGKSKALPDQASLSVEFSDTRMDASDAREQVDKQIAKLLRILKTFDLKEKSLDTSQINIFPQYDYRNNSREFRGYQVVRQAQFILSDLAQLDKLLKTLTEHGINQLNQISFSLSDPQQYKEQALEKAMANARATAGKLAQGFGVELGKIYSVSYRSDHHAAPPIQARMQMEVASLSADASPTYQQKELEFTANIQVAFTFE